MLGWLNRTSDLLLMALLSIFAVAPLFHPGFFVGQSGLAAVYNLADFQANPSLSWRPGLGLDSSFGSFALLPYYIGGLFTKLGLSPLGAIKLLYVIGFVLSATGAFALAREIWAGPATGAGNGMVHESLEPDRLAGNEDRHSAANRPAILAGTIYTYLPYHLASTYIRGDVGDSLAFGLAPWLGLCLWRLVNWRSASVAVWLAISLLLVAGLVLTTPGLGLLIMIVLVGGALVHSSNHAEPNLLLRGAVAAIAPLALGISLAWPISPSTLQSGTTVSQMVDLSRLFSPVWGEAPNPLGGPPVQLGLVAAALAILSLVPAGDGENRAAGARNLIRYLQAVSFMVIALMLPPLAPVWAALEPLVGEPSRLLLLAALPLSILAGSMLLRQGLAHPLAFAGLVTISVLASYSYLSPKFSTIDEPSKVVGAKVGDDIVLLDYRLELEGAGDQLNGGGRVKLRLVWQALQPPKEDLTVFTHILDSGQQLRSQHDGPPAGGTRPTSKWRTGDVIVDDHILQLDSNAPAGGYTLEVGMYVPQSGERLPVIIKGQSDTRVVLATLKEKG